MDTLTHIAVCTNVPNTRWARQMALGALAVLWSVAAAAASGDPPARVGRLSWLAGDVSLRDSASATPNAAQRNWPVTSGNVLTTGSSGRAEVWVGSAALRLDVDTELQIDQLDDTRLRLRLNHGSLALRAAVPEAAHCASVDTPLGRFSPMAPGEFRIDASGGSLQASAWSGSLSFEGGNGVVTVRPGQRGEFSAAVSGVSVSMSAPMADDFEAFVKNRDAAFDGRTAARYVSPEMTGIEDLDSYGHWQQTAEFGAVWVPAVAADWAPYRYGRWAWVAPWGWTWVDDAPWGFAPFHYGRWGLWGNHWCWVPGTYVARPVYAPALVAWSGSAAPGGLAVNVSMGVGAVGWFPLAPHEVYVPPYAVSATYVHNINITHVTNIANVTNITAPSHYTFQNNAHATTVVDSAVLTGREPVERHLMRATDPRLHAVLNGPAFAAPPVAMAAPMPSVVHEHGPAPEAESSPARPLAGRHRESVEARPHASYAPQPRADQHGREPREEMPREHRE